MQPNPGCIQYPRAKNYFIPPTNFQAMPFWRYIFALINCPEKNSQPLKTSGNGWNMWVKSRNMKKRKKKSKIPRVSPKILSQRWCQATKNCFWVDSTHFSECFCMISISLWVFVQKLWIFLQKWQNAAQSGLHCLFLRGLRCENQVCMVKPCFQLAGLLFNFPPSNEVSKSATRQILYITQEVCL